MAIPTGTLTFLFTDIEGSTQLAQQYPDRWETLRARHHAILQAAVKAYNGYVFQIIGDAFCVAFHTAKEGINAAIATQCNLQAEDWGGATIKIRMGIHTDEAGLQANGEYHGYLALSRVQRLMSAGHGGQVLISLATESLLRNPRPDQVTLKDMGERRLKDLIQPEHIFQLVIPNLPSDFPPLKTLDIYRHNLSAQTTTFIGREQAIAEVKQELEKHRLVTLTGSGGTGKTRLSLQVAADLLDHFQHGIWFIELAPLTNPDLIPQTILSAIGIQEQSGRLPLDTLKEYLQDKPALILLDNCEHLVSAIAPVADKLLSAAPLLKVLASSREALGVKGEMSYPVPSLSHPDIKHLPAIEQLSQYEAVRLFIDRAALVSPHFDMNKENAPFITQICYRLEGIPLAIELAAARIKMLSVEQISKRLDDRFRLLTGGARTALPRQQTLRATIDWSYNLLTEQERSLLRRLAVFIGGWTLDAAEEVCSDGGIETNQILDLMSQLVNKSLATVDEHTHNGETRYRILETVRQYAREKLFDTEDASPMRDKHLAYFVKLAEQAEPELVRSNQVFWLNKLDDELDNLRIAMEWSLTTNNSESALRIAGALGQFWWTHNIHLEEGREWIRRATEAGSHNNAQSKALHWGSVLARTQEDFLIARKLSNESLELCHMLDDKEGTAKALSVLGSIDYFENEFSTAQKNWNDALIIYRQLEDKQGIASVLNNLGHIYLAQGNAIKAQSIYEECLTICRELENKWFTLYIIGNLGDTAFAQGNSMRSRELYEEGLTISGELGDKNSVAVALSGLANVLCQEGHFYRSAQIQGTVISILKELGTFLEPIEQASFDKTAGALKASLGEEVYQQEFGRGKTLSLEQAIELALKKEPR
jgi:predicted ATPase/class 3 adenylate cyclase